MMKPGFGSDDAPMVIDVQCDFCAGGALAVPGGAAFGDTGLEVARRDDEGGKRALAQMSEGGARIETTD